MKVRDNQAVKIINPCWKGLRVEDSVRSSVAGTGMGESSK
jgi:hypothetical protein